MFLSDAADDDDDDDVCRQVESTVCWCPVSPRWVFAAQRQLTALQKICKVMTDIIIAVQIFCCLRYFVHSFIVRTTYLSRYWTVPIAFNSH